LYLDFKAPPCSVLSYNFIHSDDAQTGEEDPDLRVVLPELDHNMKGTDSEYEK
jgi:hypothetical protein